MATSIDFSGRFGGTPTGYELLGTWPSGLSINASGVVSGTATVPGIYRGLAVKATNASINFARTNNFDIVVTKFGALVPSFEGEMKGVEVGTGDLTVTHTADLYAPDYLGIYRRFGANEPVWAGGRVGLSGKTYANYNTNPLMAGLTAWYDCDEASGVRADRYGGSELAETGGTVGTAAGIIGSAMSFVRADNAYMTGTATLLGGPLFTVNVWVRVTDASANNYILDTSVTSVSNNDLYVSTNGAVNWRGGVALNSPSSTITLNNWHMVTGVWDMATGQKVLYVDGVQADIDTTAVYDTSSIDALVGRRRSGADNFEGQIDLISRWERRLSDAEILSLYNSGSAYAYPAGNEQPLPDMPYLQYYPAAENLVPYSNNTTNWGQSTTVNTFDQVGITGEPNTASRCESTDTGATPDAHPGTINYTNTGGSLTFKWWIKKDASTAGYYHNIRARTQVGGTTQEAWVAFRASDGDIAVRTGTIVGMEVIEEGEWYVILLEQAQDANAQASCRLYVAYGPDSSSADATLTGHAVVGNCEYHVGTIPQVRGLGPIFTTTAAVATDAPVYGWDSANIGLLEGAVYIEFDSSIGNSESTTLQVANGALVSLLGNNEPMWIVQNQVKSYGGGSQPANANWDIGSNKAGYPYSATDNEFSVVVNGTTSGPLGFTALRAGSPLKTGTGLKGAMGTRNLQGYVTIGYAEGKQIIDDLMES